MKTLTEVFQQLLSNKENRKEVQKEADSLLTLVYSSDGINYIRWQKFYSKLCEKEILVAMVWS